MLIYKFLSVVGLCDAYVAGIGRAVLRVACRRSLGEGGGTAVLIGFRRAREC